MKERFDHHYHLADHANEPANIMVGDRLVSIMSVEDACEFVKHSQFDRVRVVQDGVIVVEVTKVKL